MQIRKGFFLNLFLILLLSAWVCGISHSLMSAWLKLKMSEKKLFSGWCIVETPLDVTDKPGSYWAEPQAEGITKKFTKINQDSSELLEKPPSLRKQKKHGV